MISAKRILVAVAIVGALFASACGNDKSGGGPVGGPPEGPPADSSPLANLTGEDLCDQFDRDAIEKEFKVELDGKPRAGMEETQSGFRQDVSCRISGPSQGFVLTFVVSTDVIASGRTPDEALQIPFDGGYESLTGLGDKAGYGKSIALGDIIVVVKRHRDTLVTFEVSIAPSATLNQIRPRMESLLVAVEPELK